MGNENSSRDTFSIGDFLLRLLGATVLVFASYNPSGYSFVSWVEAAWGESNVGPEHYFVGMILLIGWVILLRATFNSLGMIGLILGTALLGTLVWMLIDFGILRGDSITFYTWISLVCVAALLAIGLSWSHVWRRLTGQVDVDDFDEN